jgi:hypothetical protein
MLNSIDEGSPNQVGNDEKQILNLKTYTKKFQIIRRKSRRATKKDREKKISRKFLIW